MRLRSFLLSALILPGAFLVASASMAVSPKTTASGDDQRWAGNLEMNGIKLDSFGNFAKSWQLVTVRYRMDSGEFRYIYANPSAWSALKAGGAAYPDGAAFAKVAYLLSHDSEFPSSMVPTQVNRYQLMVKDQKKFKDTGGWGFALFNAAGQTFPGHPDTVSKSCIACHQIVREKGFVFAEPMDSAMTFFADAKGPKKTGVGRAKFLPTFESLAVAKLPATLVKRLPPGARAVSSVQGDLRSNLFQGTLDEVRPFLAVEALRAGRPALLLSSDSSRFSAVFKSKNSKGCDFGAEKGVSMVSVVTTVQASPFSAATAYVPGVAESLPSTHEFCFVTETAAPTAAPEASGF